MKHIFLLSLMLASIPTTMSRSYMRKNNLRRVARDINNQASADFVAGQSDSISNGPVASEDSQTIVVAHSVNEAFQSHSANEAFQSHSANEAFESHSANEAFEPHHDEETVVATALPRCDVEKPWILFVVDGSEGLKGADFAEFVDFIADSLEALPIGTVSAVIQFGDLDQELFGFDHFDGKPREAANYVRHHLIHLNSGHRHPYEILPTISKMISKSEQNKGPGGHVIFVMHEEPENMAKNDVDSIAQTLKGMGWTFWMAEMQHRPDEARLQSSHLLHAVCNTVLPGDTCDSEDTCTGGAYCKALTHMCECPQGYSLHGFLCRESALPGGSCSRGQICIDGSYCDKEILHCDCVKGQPVHGKCQASANPDEYCGDGRVCTGGSVCDANSQICRCHDSHELVNSECIDKAEPGEICSQGQICGGGTVCKPTTGRCECRDGKSLMNGKCEDLPGPGDSCAPHGQCARGSTCNSHTLVCECNEGTTEAHGECLDSAYPGEPCGEGKVCTGGSCCSESTNQCLCREGHVISNGQCFETANPGESCTNEKVCVGKSYCDVTTEMCTCNAGNVIDDKECRVALELANPGESCADGEICQGLSSCNLNTFICQCPTGTLANDRDCDEIVYANPGESCLRSKVCIGGSFCDQGTYVCLCQSGYYSEGSCVTLPPCQRLKCNFDDDRFCDGTQEVSIEGWRLTATGDVQADHSGESHAGNAILQIQPESSGQMVLKHLDILQPRTMTFEYFLDANGTTLSVDALFEQDFVEIFRHAHYKLGTGIEMKDSSADHSSGMPWEQAEVSIPTGTIAIRFTGTGGHQAGTIGIDNVALEKPVGNTMQDCIPSEED